MAYPASVNQIQLTKSRPGNPRPRRRLQPGEDVLPDPEELSASIGVGGPSLDFGRLGAARLAGARGVRGKWAWKWVGDQQDDVPLVLCDDGTLLFPPTRTLAEDTDNFSLDVLQASADEYLYTFPDFEAHDHLSEFILPELVDMHSRAKRENFDLYRGETLAVVRNKRAKVAKTVMVFPTGELGNHLNVSAWIPAIKTSRTRRIGEAEIFTPTAKAMERFPTEILQVCAADLVTDNRLDRDATLLLVRLHASTHLVHLIPNTGNDALTDDGLLKTERIGVLATADTEGRRIMDVALDTVEFGRCLAVDEGGGVWYWKQEWKEVAEKMERTMKLVTVRGSISTKKDQFFRIAFGTRPGTALVVSELDFQLIDLDRPELPPITLITLTGRNRHFTSIDKTAQRRNAMYICLCTTYEVLWIDELKPGPPALSIKHDYGDGKLRDLQVTSVDTSAGDCTLLWSYSDLLVIVCNTDSSFPIRSLCQPFALNLGSHQVAPKVSLVSKPTSSSSVATLELLTLSTDGAVRLFRTMSRNGKSAVETSTFPRKARRILHHISQSGVRWDSNVKALTQKGPDKTISEKAQTRYKEINCRWAWMLINEAAEKADNPEFTVAALTQHMRELDAPFEHYTTGGELARDVIISDRELQRSHLLQPVSIGEPYVETLRELDEIDFGKYLQVVMQAHQHIEVRDPARQTASAIYADLIETFSVENSSESTKKRTEADAAALALDLALSRFVLSNEPIGQVPSATPESLAAPEDLLARVTLDDRAPPPFTFSVLSPRPAQLGDAPVSPESEIDQSSIEARTALDSPTVRSLMNEWKIGEDPKEYKWSGWRDKVGSEQPTITRPVRPLPSPRHHQGDFASQPQPLRPIARSQPLPSAGTLSRGPPQVRSSPAPLPTGQVQSFAESTIQHASTQVERGPFGGRPAAKKKVKKRTAGF